ncbi:MAG: hypothetical protein ACLR4Z_17075 [Butyricicoccaceae bacterium]
MELDPLQRSGRRGMPGAAAPERRGPRPPINVANYIIEHELE